MIYARRCNVFSVTASFYAIEGDISEIFDFCEIIVDKSRSIGYNNKALFKCTK